MSGKDKNERRGKSGLDYFDLDCFLNDKIRMIQAKYGLQGFAVVIKLFQHIYGEKGYYCVWDEDAAMLFAMENGMAGNHSTCVEIADYCMERGIFSREKFDSYDILTSRGIQERYFNAVSRRKKVEIIQDYVLLGQKQMAEYKNLSFTTIDSKLQNVDILALNADIQPLNADKNQQSRVEYMNTQNTPCFSYSCAEPPGGDALAQKQPQEQDVVVKSLLLKDGSHYAVSKSYCAKLARLYPDVDVMRQLARMENWINDNPGKRKTRRGIRRFINNWLLGEEKNSSEKNYSAGVGQTAKYRPLIMEHNQDSESLSKLERELLRDTDKQR